MTSSGAKQVIRFAVLRMVHAIADCNRQGDSDHAMRVMGFGLQSPIADDHPSVASMLSPFGATYACQAKIK